MPEKPPEGPTIKLDQTQIQAELLKKLQGVLESGFASVNANLDLMSHSVDDLRDRVVLLERRQSVIDQRLDANSIRVRGVSATDEEQSAQLAQEREARESLAAKVDELMRMQNWQTSVLAKLEKVASNPLIKDVLKVVATAFLAWAATKGFR